MPILGVPLALIGLAALPALTAIYWLRTRFRRQQVSSLFLWSLVAQAHGGGRKATRLQTPLLWLLELLALLLLALAAAGPRIPRADRVVPVMVVLDDSFSMSAIQGDGQSVREAGLDAIRQELSGLGPFVAHFVVAGPEPALQEGSVTRLADIESAVGDWRCESTSSGIGAAVALAREVGGADCRVLVISDRASTDGQTPDEESGNDQAEDDQQSAQPATQAGRLRWRAVGEARPNAGIVNAVRSSDPQRDEVLLEVANFSDKPYRVTLTFSVASDTAGVPDAQMTDAMGPARVVDRRTLELAGHETRRLRLVPPNKDEVFISQIDDDALSVDNRVVLLPPDRELLAVSVSIADPVLNKAVRSAVRASGVARISPGRGRLSFTDRVAEPPTASPSADETKPAASTAPGTGNGSGEIVRPWRVEFEEPKADAIDAYLGPFVIDYAHPVSAGLSLTGLVWAAPVAESGQAAAGRALVSAGDTPLILERGLVGNAKALRIRLRADRSTLLSSAAWPVLVANIIDWRRAELPGLLRVNARPGMPVRLNLASSVDHVSLAHHTLDGRASDEPPDRIDTHNGTVVLTSDRPGIYVVSAGGQTHRYTVNALSPEESDISGAVTLDSGLWNDERTLRTDYRGLSWILGLLALGLLAVHAWLQYRPTGASPAVLSEGTA
jgi:Aerotolerance regulator N-terminal